MLASDLLLHGDVRVRQCQMRLGYNRNTILLGRCSARLSVVTVQCLLVSAVSHVHIEAIITKCQFASVYSHPAVDSVSCTDKWRYIFVYI